MGWRFWRVWGGEALSGVGDAVLLVAFGWAVLAATGSAGVLAGTLIAGTLPRGALLVGGAVVDRLSRTSNLLHLAWTALEPVSLAGAGLLAAVDVRLAFAVAVVPVLAAGAWLLSTPATRALGTATPRR